MLPNKMVSKRQVFLFRVLPILVKLNNTLVFSTDIGLETLILIYLMWHRSITDSYIAFFSAVKLAPNVEVCTAV